MRKIFVGGLAWATDEYGLREAFAEYGTIQYAKVVTDRETGRSRGFGFVEFSTDEEAANAIRSMDGANVAGRSIRVNEANERSSGSGPRRSEGHAGGGYNSDGGYSTVTRRSGGRREDW